MTKISHYPVEKEKMSLFLDDFWTAVASFKDKSEAQNFFNQFLTHTERKMFAKRFQIAMMLLLGYDYQNIRQRIKVSDTTIGKINNWLKENQFLVEIAKRIIRLKTAKAEKQEWSGARKSRKTTGSILVEAGLGEIVKKAKEIRKESSLSH